MRYVRSLDGIRGLAVLLVILFHFGYFPAGWTGVQVFFTLSGYLITSILLDDKALPLGAYVGRFYWRRALRIFPLYYAFLALMAACFVLLGVPASFEADWPFLLTYTANFARMRDVDVGPAFVHIWSLAVEEQFYLIWPLLVFFLSPRAFKVAVAALLLGAPVLRLVLFLTLIRWGHSAEYAGRLAYVLPFTQFDAFAAGAAIPLWGLDRLKRPGLLFLGALGLAGALGVMFLLLDQFRYGHAFISSLGYPMYMTGHLQYVWGYSLLNFISSLGIVCTLRGLAPLAFLGSPILVRVGKVSYGVYVYHLPLLLVGESLAAWLGLKWNPTSRALFFVVYLGSVMVVSEASFRWLEAPFLKLKDYWKTRARVEGVAQKTN